MNGSCEVGNDVSGGEVFDGVCGDSHSDNFDCGNFDGDDLDGGLL